MSDDRDRAGKLFFSGLNINSLVGLTFDRHVRLSTRFVICRRRYLVNAVRSIDLVTLLVKQPAERWIDNSSVTLIRSGGGWVEGYVVSELRLRSHKLSEWNCRG